MPSCTHFFRTDSGFPENPIQGTPDRSLITGGFFKYSRFIIVFSFCLDFCGGHTILQSGSGESPSQLLLKNKVVKGQTHRARRRNVESSGSGSNFFDSGSSGLSFLLLRFFLRGNSHFLSRNLPSNGLVLLFKSADVGHRRKSSEQTLCSVISLWDILINA